MKVKKKSYRSRQKDKRAAIAAKRQDEKYRTQERKKDVERKRRTKEEKREKRKAVEKTEAELEKKRAAEAERKRIAKEKRAATNLKKQAEKQAKKNEVYRFQQTQLNTLKENIKNASNQFTPDEVKRFKRLQSFINAFRKVPENECVSCEGVFFTKSTRKFDVISLHNLFQTVLIKDESLENITSFEEFASYFIESSGCICKTCYNYWSKGKVPPVHLKCGLKVLDIPECIQQLSDFEELLISPMIPFIQVVETIKYAKYPQLGAKGAVVLIEPDQTVFLDLLPRNVNDMSKMCIELARRIDHKSTYAEGVVNVQNVLSALKYLVDTPLFKQYNIQYDQELLDAYDPTCLKDNINFILRSHIKPTEKENVKVIKKEQKKETQEKKIEMETKDDDFYIDAELMKEIIELERQEVQRIQREQEIVRPQVEQIDFLLSNREFFPNAIRYQPEDKNLDIFYLCSFNSAIHALIGPYLINQDFKNLINNREDIESFELLRNIVDTFSNEEKQSIWINYIVNSTRFEQEFGFSKMTKNQSKNVAYDPIFVIEQLLENFPSIRAMAACDCGNVEFFLKKCRYFFDD